MIISGGIMFGKALGRLWGEGKKIVDDTEQIDDRFYADVIDELSKGYKDKALVGKAIAQSDGNKARFDSIYMKLRARALQEEFVEQPQEQEQKKIVLKFQAKEKQKLVSKINKLYSSGYFLYLFKDKIREKGFTVTWYSNYTLKKDGHKYYTGVNYNNMDFIIKDTKGKIVHIFHFEENQLDI